jgi:hypothetical protein
MLTGNERPMPVVSELLACMNDVYMLTDVSIHLLPAVDVTDVAIRTLVRWWAIVPRNNLPPPVAQYTV